MNSMTSSIIRAIEIGTTTDLNDSQKQNYSLFIKHLKLRLVKKSEDALVALEQLLARPNSKARIAVFEEELDYFTESKALEGVDELVSLANRFLESVGVEPNIQQGKYYIHDSSVKGIVVGEANNISQSFSI